jgi:hypothetical protein
MNAAEQSWSPCAFQNPTDWFGTLGAFMRGWIAGLLLILTSPVLAAEPIVSDGEPGHFPRS